MPQVDCIIAMPGLTIDRVEAAEALHVWMTPTQRPRCMYCQSEALQIKASYLRTLKHGRQNKRLTYLHVKVPKFHCLDCNKYFRQQIAGILPRRRSTENFRLEVVEQHHDGITQAQLARRHEIGTATVERWYQDAVEARVKELCGRACPQFLGIDEHFFTRRHGFATTLVNLKTHKVFDVVKGRSQSSLHGYLKNLAGKEHVKVVVMDLCESYRSIIKQYFPNALIVADRFHVIRLINEHFLRAWQNIDPAGRKNRGLLSLMRRHPWKLDPEQKISLTKYLAQYPTLKRMYEAKQRLVIILLKKGIDKQAVKCLLPKLLRLIEVFKKSPLKIMAQTLMRWIEPVCRMLRFTKTNGITEGLHTKMEVISRRAYGFRNFNNYRLRVLAHCGGNFNLQHL